MKHILYSDIYPLHSTKLSILKMILSMFIWTCSHSYEILHVYSTCTKIALNNSSKYFLQTCLQTMGTIIMIRYISNLHIICDRLPLSIFNKSILIIVIMFFGCIVFLWLKIIVLLINFWSIITITSIFNIFYPSTYIIDILVSLCMP